MHHRVLRNLPREELALVCLVWWGDVVGAHHVIGGDVVSKSEGRGDDGGACGAGAGEQGPCHPIATLWMGVE